MSFLMFNQGEKITAEALLNKTAPQELDVMLFKNNQTLTDGRTEADFTEADFTGYTRAQLTASNWVVTPNAPTSAQYPMIAFKSTADQTAQNIYGYVLLQRVSGKAICGWRFDDGPYSVSKTDDEIDVTPDLRIKKVGE